MAGKGGARPGAGRKAKGAKAARKLGPVAAAEDRVTDRLPVLIDNLFYLADGHFEQIEEKWEPGEPNPDGTPADRVLASRKITWAAPDRQANVYLVDRVLGRPTERREVTVEDGSTPPRIIIPRLPDG